MKKIFTLIPFAAFAIFANCTPENSDNSKNAPVIQTQELLTVEAAGGDINMLNPSDIESIDVLKDAASAAISVGWQASVFSPTPPGSFASSLPQETRSNKTKIMEEKNFIINRYLLSMSLELIYTISSYPRCNPPVGEPMG